MTQNAKLCERLTVQAKLGPVAVVNSEQFTGYVSMAQHGQALVIASTGNMAAETIDVKVYQAQDGSGTGEKLLKAATQLAAHASNNDSKQVVVNVRAEDLDTDNGFTHIRAGAVTGSSSGGVMDILILAGDSRVEPATDAASVVEVVE